jgi:NADH-quinone oxidoreductase subunit M
MGFVMLGISTLTSFGMNAAVFGMVAHGLITGMLFFVAGSVKERYHTLEIARLSGMLKQVPHLAWILGFCVMASLGLPGLAGFWGEFPARDNVPHLYGHCGNGNCARSCVLVVALPAHSFW